VLIILAGITLNAVIGEKGIIFQAKDTKNMVANETKYDNKQLSQLQDELKDDQLYSGIGIIPGTDIGGPSEGGEQGNSHGGGNQGGSGTNQGGTNTGGNPSSPNVDIGGGGQVPGETAQDPTIYVLSGEEIAASVYRSDVTLQIATQDKTQKIKYILSTTVDEINNTLYPNGFVRELDIENGGTITLTRDGEYTLTAYAYDVFGNKSNPTAIWIKIQKSGEGFGTGVTITKTSGIEGKDGWYTSNITYRVLGQDQGSTRVTYRVSGTAKSNGRIDKDYVIGELDTGEVDIANGTTFKIAIDGEFEIRAYTYDNSGTRLSEATMVTVKRDASKPVILSYTGNQEIKDSASESGFLINLVTQDLASGLANTKKYTYRHKLATKIDYTDEDSEITTKLYQNLAQDKTYDMYVLVRDQAGNIAASDIISKPALWISSNPTVGEMVNEGKEGARKYCNSSDVDISMTGQDKNNVKIGKVTYQILGTTTGDGEIDGTTYTAGTALPTDEQEMDNTKTIPIRADGNWTVKIHTYDETGTKKVSTNTLEVTRDTVDPEPPTFTASGTQGETGYYRSDIQVTVKGSDATSFKKITYQISGASTTGETDITNGGTIDLPAVDGTYNITGYVYDKAGRKSRISDTLTVTRDTVPPTANTPTVTTANAVNKGEVEGTISYYKADVAVQMNGGTDANSLQDRMTCMISGTATKAGKIDNEDIAQNQTVNKTIETTKNGTFHITADGKWTITVYTYDYAGNRSNANTITVVKDTEEPKITSWTLTESGQKPKSLEMQVEATDSLSGLATTGTYTYSIVTDPATANVADTVNTHTYTENLNIDSEYAVSVVVKDKAGNTSTKTENVRTKNGYYLKDVAQLGDYVDINAGTWLDTVDTPTDHGQLGDVIAGTHIGTGVGDSDSGWYIKEITNEAIVLYSAGNPATMRVSEGKKPTYLIPNNTNGNINVVFSDEKGSWHKSRDMATKL